MDNPVFVLQVTWETIRQGSGYVAVGISKDAVMGDKEGQGDIMFICNQVNIVKEI